MNVFKKKAQRYGNDGSVSSGLITDKFSLVFRVVHKKPSCLGGTAIKY
jgi:hypothetical protein